MQKKKNNQGNKSFCYFLIKTCFMIICYQLQKPKFPRKLPKLCKNDNRPKENFFM